MRGSHNLTASAEIPNLDIVHVSYSHLWTPEVDPSNAPSTTTYLGVLPRCVGCRSSSWHCVLDPIYGHFVLPDETPSRRSDTEYPP
jgi:hypothetical protein